jgi:adenylate cyclase
VNPSRFRQLLFGVFIGLAGIVVNLTPVGLALEEELGLYWLFQLRGAVSAPDNVVVISIDQPSATQFDLPINPRFWPRDLHARLIEKLADAGARVIAFDLIFETHSDIPENDEKLARAMQKAGNVVVVERLDVEEIPLFASQVDPVQHGAVTAGTIPLLPMIENAALAQAPFPLPRSTSVNAYWTFKTSAGDAPTLPTMVLQAYTMAAYEEFVRLLTHVNSAYALRLPASKETLGIEELIFTLHHIFNNEPPLAQQMLAELRRDKDLDAEKRKMIHSLIKLYSGNKMRYLNFFGPPRSVQTISYYQALQQLDGDTVTSSFSDFNGKAVFIGFSAASQSEQDRVRDDYHTVFSNADGLTISGVEIAATSFANLLEDKPVRLLPITGSMAVLFLVGFVFGIIFLILPNRSATIVGVFLAVIYVVNASYQFKEAGIWLPLFIPLIMQLPLAVFGSLSLKYYNEKRERKQIEEQFGRFLPERVVKHIKESAGQVTSNNQLVYGVCLATDVEDYTPLSEKMSPGRLSQLMNDYYAALFEPVEKYGGDISDVVGDAMLALWAAPSVNAELRKKACLACLDIAAAVDCFNQADNRPKLTTRIGLHFGEIMLGTVGTGRHFEYRAVGDVVNTTNRIQGANKKLGTRMLLSGEVTEGLDDFLVRPFGDFLLVGKSSPVNLVELITHKQTASSEQSWLCEIFADALQAYQLQQWQQACDGFSEILKVFPDDGPARFFLKHCQQHKLAPPAGAWPSVIQLTSK